MTEIEEALWLKHDFLIASVIKTNKTLIKEYNNDKGMVCFIDKSNDSVNNVDLNNSDLIKELLELNNASIKSLSEVSDLIKSKY